MKRTAFIGAGAAIIALAMASCASAENKYLTVIESPVFHTSGDHAAITARAKTCIAQIVKPGFAGAAVIISSDPDAGMIVANNGFEFQSGLISYQGRATLTFEAKDGRFRMRDTNIEALRDPTGWQPVGTWPFGGSGDVTAVLNSINASVAACIMARPTEENW